METSKESNSEKNCVPNWRTLSILLIVFVSDILLIISFILQFFESSVLIDHLESLTDSQVIHAVSIINGTAAPQVYNGTRCEGEMT
jgi:hypothetical protein